MSDQEEQQASPPASAPTPPTPGEWLRQERERQGRTVSQIAADLHIGVYMVEAIENNQFAVLGAEVFARGHLRKYVTLLGLSTERGQELYQSLSDRPRDQDPVPVMHRASEPSIAMGPDSKERRALNPTQWTFAIAGGTLVVAGVVAWLFFSAPKPEPAQPVVAVEEPSDTSPVPVETAPVMVPPVTAKPLATQRAAGAPQVAAPASAAVSPAVARGKLRLRFSFNQESWVEVYDARGTRMLYDVGFTGQTRGVDVEPPAQIVLGQAAAVSTEVNGREITVPARRIANQVARFTVGADGAAQ